MSLAVGAGACRSSDPSPPYDRAVSIEARAPRAIESSAETTVRVALTNTGRAGWDPTRVHLSYHWLWLVPRELAHRSRRLPYQEGIRTQLPASVSPGGTVEVDGRLLAPRVPGVYWLQWDMVDEGVVWFVQVSPRASRQLVVVLPIPAELFAPLPLIVALIGLVLLRRGSRIAFATTADVWWCAAALFSKSLLLVPAALLEPTRVAYWLMVACALVPPLVLVWALPGRLRPWASLALGVFGTLLMLGDVIYYRFFGDVLSAPAILAAGQTGRVWGSVRSLLTADLLWFVIDIPFAVWLAARLGRLVPDPRDAPAARAGRGDLVPHPPERPVAIVAVPLVVLAFIGVALSAPSTLRSIPLDQMFRDRAVAEQLGPFGFHVYDTWMYARTRWFRSTPTSGEIDEIRRWFFMRAPLRAGGPVLGVARGKNLIVIQVESLQDFVVDYRVDGQEVMPHLRRWSDDSLRFTSVTDQTNEGRTSDAEFVAMTSLLPLAHGAVAFRYPGNHYVALPRVLAEHGYQTLSAVPFEAGFWNRRVLHPAYGFQQSLFEPDFELTEQIGWGLNDRDFLRQMVPRLEKLRRPFGAWLITLSLHHPFDDFPARHKVLKLGTLEGSSFGNYLHTMRFFDDALDEFKRALADDGLLDDTVMMVFGDHDAGFARDEALSAAMRIAPTEIAWELNDRIPLFIRVPALSRVEGLEQTEASQQLPARTSQPPVARASPPPLAGVQSKPAGQTDFAPTILALLGIDAVPLPYAGRNLLGDVDDPPIVRPYGNWVDKTHVFISHGGADRSDCYDRTTMTPVSERACRTADLAARRARDVSRLVVSDDLQQELLGR